MSVRARHHACALRRRYCRSQLGTRRRSVLQGQAAHHPDQLRVRRPDRHRRADVRQACCAPHRRTAQHRHPEYGRRGRHRRRQVHGRGGAARRQHGGLLHRHRLHVRARSRALPRRLQDLRVRRHAGRHHRALRAHRRAARHEGRDGHHQGQRPDRRRLERRHAQGSADAARLRYAGHPVQIRHRLPLEPGGAARDAARRDQFLRRNHRRATAASSSPAWSRPAR